MQGFLNPSEILKQINLRQDMQAADFGCGAGGWTIPLAKILDKGKVFAFDIQENALSALRGRAKFENVSNIETKKCDLETPKSTGLEENSLDLVLVPNLLFQIENKKAVFEEALRVLKSGGKALVLDWTAGSHLGPQESRVSEEEVSETAKAMNFNLEKKLEAGNYHYGLVFAKP